MAAHGPRSISITVVTALGLTLSAAPAAMAAQAPALQQNTADELVVPAAARAVPRATQILNAGTTGFLWLQEGDDRLLWTDYRSGDTTGLPQRLTEPVRYNIDDGYFERLAAPFTISGRGSDTVGLYYAEPAPHVTLLEGPGTAGSREVPLPADYTYQGVYGDAVLAGTGEGALVLLRSRDGAVTEQAVTGLPADGVGFRVETGDGRSVVLRYEIADRTHWSLVDLATAAATALPDYPGESWEVDGYLLAADHVIRLRTGRYKIDVLDRQNLSATPRTVDSGSFGYDASFAVLDSYLLGLDRMALGNSRFRGEPLFAKSTVTSGARMVRVLDPAAHGLVQAPDGSVLVAGAETYLEEGDLDVGIYRIDQAADGSITRSRLTTVQPMPAQVYGLSLGSGVLTRATNSTIYQPSTIIGVYHSTWLTTPAGGGVPAITRSTVDGYATGRDGFCTPGGSLRCIHMFADGTGFHGREHGLENGDTMLMANGDKGWGPRVDTGAGSPYLKDLSGRFGVVNDGTYGLQYVTTFGTTPAVLQKRDQVAAAVWGDTLWSAEAESGTVRATRLPAGSAVETFSTTAACTPTQLQAVTRWVYWRCDSGWGTTLSAGVYDRATRTTTAAPAGEVLLGDGYLVHHQDGAGLRLTDLTGGSSTRTLATEAELGAGHQARTSWTVDRFGGGVAWADGRQRVHVVPSGVPASALTAIDSSVGTSSANWAGTWWLSKPAASWQVTIRNQAGATLRTISGTAEHGLVRAAWDGLDQAGVRVPDGTWTWALTAQPADGRGPALTLPTPNTPPPPVPPATLRATKAPSISGTAMVGSTLRAAAGTWNPTAGSYAYQWTANGVAIRGATGSAYVIPSTMLGKRLSVRVTAKRAGHPSGTAASAASAAVTRGRAATATRKPKVTGTAKAGRTVRASAGAWSMKADSYRYEWRVNGKLIRGATKSSLKLTRSMRNKKITVTVIWRKAGYTDGRATSAKVTVRR